MSNKGCSLITIEGIDGSGKSTLINGTDDIPGLRSRYNDAIFTSEPKEEYWTGNLVREAIKKDINDLSMLFLFLADHAQHIEKTIKPALDNGSVVISDRYIDSRYAYQAPILEDHLSIDALKWLRYIQEEDWSIQPDLTIVLDVPASVAMDRLRNRDNKEKFENLEQLKRSRNIYHKMAMVEERYELIDATEPIDYVIEYCDQIIKDELRSSIKKS